MFGIRPDDYMVFLLLFVEKQISKERKRTVNCENKGVIEELKRVKLGKCVKWGVDTQEVELLM